MHWIDPDSLKPLKSRVARFLFNPKGDADGMLLANGLEAHFPPHLSDEILSAIHMGDAVTLYGVKPRDAEMIACIAIETAKGQRIDDRGPPEKKKKHAAGEGKVDAHQQHAELEGTIERLLHGPRGEVRGVLFTDGTIVRFPAQAAHGVRRLLTLGAVLGARGELRKVSETRVIEAKALGSSKVRLKPLPKKRHD